MLTAQSLLVVRKGCLPTEENKYQKHNCSIAFISYNASNTVYIMIIY